MGIFFCNIIYSEDISGREYHYSLSSPIRPRVTAQACNILFYLFLDASKASCEVPSQAVDCGKPETYICHENWSPVAIRTEFLPNADYM
jgi:hypothetical protein